MNPCHLCRDSGTVATTTGEHVSCPACGDSQPLGKFVTISRYDRGGAKYGKCEECGKLMDAYSFIAYLERHSYPDEPRQYGAAYIPDEHGAFVCPRCEQAIAAMYQLAVVKAGGNRIPVHA